MATIVARVSDWRALEHLNQATLLDGARRAGATQYRIYRSLTDASLALILGELPDYEAAQELALLCGEHPGVLRDACELEAGVWEATPLEGIA